mgnify:CR=1 FL=1
MAAKKGFSVTEGGGNVRERNGIGDERSNGNGFSDEHIDGHLIVFRAARYAGYGEVVLDGVFEGAGERVHAARSADDGESSALGRKVQTAGDAHARRRDMRDAFRHFAARDMKYLGAGIGLCGVDGVVQPEVLCGGEGFLVHVYDDGYRLIVQRDLTEYYAQRARARYCEIVALVYTAMEM